jgi:hypothetical protein
MNSDMLAVGVELGDHYDFDLVHCHDWLVAVAGPGLGPVSSAVTHPWY